MPPCRNPHRNPLLWVFRGRCNWGYRRKCSSYRQVSSPPERKKKKKKRKIISCEIISEGCKLTRLQLCRCFYPKCTAVSLQTTLIRKPHLAHAVVCKLDVTLRIQQHIVQFQVSVDDSPLVEVVERQTDFCWVESETQRGKLLCF